MLNSTAIMLNMLDAEPLLLQSLLKFLQTFIRLGISA